MMKIRNATRIDHASETISDGAFACSEDADFIRELVQRTVVPRHFIVEKDDNCFEFIAKHKQLVGFKSTGEFKFIDSAADIVAQTKAVKEFIQSFGNLGDDDELTIRRVDSALLAILPTNGVSLSAIDFSVEIATPTVEPTNYTLRVVVDNEQLDNNIEPTKDENPVITSPAQAVSQTIPTDTVGAVREFYEHVRNHANYVILKDRAGETIDSYGFLPDLDASVLSGIAGDFGKFDNTAQNALGAGPKLISMVGHRSDNIAMIYVISSERIMIAEVGTTKLGRIMMDWNALLATKADK